MAPPRTGEAQEPQVPETVTTASDGGGARLWKGTTPEPK